MTERCHIFRQYEDVVIQKMGIVSLYCKQFNKARSDNDKRKYAIKCERVARDVDRLIKEIQTRPECDHIS